MKSRKAQIFNRSKLQVFVLINSHLRPQWQERKAARSKWEVPGYKAPDGSINGFCNFISFISDEFLFSLSWDLDSEAEHSS